jgi:hypothetical protein
MKLAAICPETNVDLEQVFSRDVIYIFFDTYNILYKIYP